MADRWFSPGTPDSSINKTDSQYITEMLLKVVLNTISLPKYDIDNSSLVKGSPGFYGSANGTPFDKLILN